MVTIYALVCQSNGRAYIGSTKAKIEKRMREHRCLLSAGKHSVGPLQDDWKTFGPGQFTIEAVQEIGTTDLPTRRRAELNWMGRYAALGLLYNEHLVSMRPTDEAIRRGVAAAHNAPGNRWTPEANEKRRQAQLGVPKGHGAKISATKRAKVMR